MMDKQQEQMSQNPKKEAESTSGFFEEEVVEDSDFDEPTEEQEGDKLTDSQQSKPEGKEQPKKAKRPRKTIEQELAELDARRQRLMEKKRSQEAHEKIVFGGTVMAMLLYMKIKSDKNFLIIHNSIIKYINENKINNKSVIEKILSNIK